jgi:hypothetical protein
MRQELVDHWTLDIDPSFRRRSADHGSIVFETPEMKICADICIQEPIDSASAVREVHYHPEDAIADFSWISPHRRIDGRASLVKEPDGWELNTTTACCGRVADMRFCFTNEALTDSALAIWRSLQYSAPDWMVMCVDADPPLGKLREALEEGANLFEALSEARRQGQMREVTAVVLKALESDSVTVRLSACQIARLMDHAVDCLLVALRARLQDSIVSIRASAADALLNFGESPEAIVLSMIEGLQKQEPPLPKGEDRINRCIPQRYYAALILAKLGAAARPVKNILVRYQSDESGDVRLRIAEALMAIGEPTSAILPPLVEGLHNPDMSERERMSIAAKLFRNGASAEDLLPTVVRALAEASDWSTRIDALTLLGDMGGQALNAVDAIEKALREQTGHWKMQIAAAGALLRIGAKNELAPRILLSALEERHRSSTRAEILWYLWHSEGLDEPALLRIAQQLVDDHPAVQAAAAILLARHGMDISAQVPSLIVALDNDNDRTRWGAAVALGEAGPAANSAVGRLLQLARGADCGDVRSAAAWALSRIDPDNPDVQSLAADRSQDTDPGVDG